MQTINKFIIFLSLIIIYSCGSTDQNMTNNKPPRPLTYLALGDSYTIGEKVDPSDRFPSIIVEKLRAEKISIEDPKIVAITGWTTDELSAAIDKENLDDTWDIVSLLIGVNNQYRGYPKEQYEREFNDLLNRAINFAGGYKTHVVVLSIPDYGYTPFGQTKDPEKISKELKEYNQYAQKLCTDKNILYLNITPFTEEGLSNPDYVAEDGLHPSGLMYRKWIDHYYSEIKKLITL